MGLKDYKKWKLKQNILEVLGITEEQLEFLPQAIELAMKIKRKPAEKTPSVPQGGNANTSTNSQRKEEKMTPEQFVEMFSGDVEEFYPNGRGK